MFKELSVDRLLPYILLIFIYRRLLSPVSGSLSISSLSTDPDICTTDCRCLDRGSVMDCQRSGLVRVPTLLDAVIILDLDHNRIIQLLNESLGTGRGSDGPRPLLEILSLQENGLVHLHAGAFSCLTELRVLRLGLNQLSTLDGSLFSNNRRLQVLDLHGNFLTSLHDESMYYLHSLDTLNVSFNRISSAEFGAGYRYTTQLNNIDLTGESSHIKH